MARQVSLLSPFPAVHLPDPFLPRERSPGAPSCFLTSGAPHVPVCPIALTWSLPIVGSAVTHTVCDVCLLHAAVGGTGACWLAPQVVMPSKDQNEQDGVSSNIWYVTPQESHLECQGQACGAHPRSRGDWRRSVCSHSRGEGGASAGPQGMREESDSHRVGSVLGKSEPRLRKIIGRSWCSVRC